MIEGQSRGPGVLGQEFWGLAGKGGGVGLISAGKDGQMRG
jgi:hypothetical protein